MKFPLSWLKTHLLTEASLDEITAALTNIGLELEGVENRGAALAPFVIAHVVEAVEGAVALGSLKRALFNRTWEHFMGHQHAPVGDALDAPAFVCSEQILYLAAPLFSGYRAQDYWAYRQMAAALLARFLPAPLIEVSAPGWVECALHRQKTAATPDRAIVHLVAYHPRRTFQPIQHVDQAWHTSDIQVRVQVAAPPQRVYLAPDGVDVPFTVEGDRVAVHLPPIGAHTVLVIE